MTIQAVGIVLYGIEALWTLIFIAVGIGMGYAFYKIAEKEDRYQLWQMIWACIIGAIILSTIDGNITAKSSLKRMTLPIATITRINGNEQKGLLLANFDDGYIILPFDRNGAYNIVKIHKQEIASVEVTTLGWLQQYIRKGKDDTEEREDELLNDSEPNKSTETRGG